MWLIILCIRCILKEECRIISERCVLEIILLSRDQRCALPFPSNLESPNNWKKKKEFLSLSLSLIIEIFYSDPFKCIWFCKIFPWIGEDMFLTTLYYLMLLDGKKKLAVSIALVGRSASKSRDLDNIIRLNGLFSDYYNSCVPIFE